MSVYIVYVTNMYGDRYVDVVFEDRDEANTYAAEKNKTNKESFSVERAPFTSKS